MAPQGLHTSQLPQVQLTAPLPLLAAALAEAEAAHIAQGLRLQEARRAQEQWALESARRAEAQTKEHAMETERKAAEQALREAERSRAMQAQLQQQLQALAAADAEAAQAFATKRESLARESQAIAQKLEPLQSTGQTQPAGLVTGQPTGTPNLPPHLLSNTTHPGMTPEYNLQIQGLAEPPNNTLGLAEPPKPAHQAPTVPQQTAPPNGAPRPEEASRERSP